jgi:hypothetical protein
MNIKRCVYISYFLIILWTFSAGGRFCQDRRKTGMSFLATIFFHKSSAVLLAKHHDWKEIKKAAKKTKTFEMQKLVKKLKSMR